MEGWMYEKGVKSKSGEVEECRGRINGEIKE